MYNPNFQQPNVYYTPGQFQNLQEHVNDVRKKNKSFILKYILFQVTDIMRNNIQLGLQRGANLDDLQIQAGKRILD